MQILAILRTLPSATPDRLGPLVKPEAEAIWALHLEGKLRAAHFLQAPGAPFPNGVTLMLEADNLAAAEAMIGALPMLAKGLISAEILPLAPFTSYEALFAHAPNQG
jgi:hypothetical protein